MNYSPCVFLLSYLGLHSGSVPVWGVMLALLYLASLWFLARPTTVGASLFWLAAAFSPASALVIERGNLDSLLFSLMTAALVARNRPAVESGCILAAATLKFFPVASLMAPWFGGRRGGRLASATAAVVFFLMVILLAGRMGAIAASLGSQDHTAFGAALPACLLHDAGLVSAERAGILRWLLTGAATLLGAVLFLVGYRTSCRGQGGELTERSRHSFLMGAPVFFLLFLSGNQMDYKVIFLFFMMPAMLELRLWADRFVSTNANAWIIMLGMYSYWTFFSDEGSLRNALLKQAVMWGVFGTAALLAGKILSRSERA